MSLKDKFSKVLMSSRAKSCIIKGNIKSFFKLSKSELVKEFLQRSIKFTWQSTTKQLQGLLDLEMHDIQGLPAVLFNNHTFTLKDIEILKNDSLYDVSN